MLNLILDLKKTVPPGTVLKYDGQIGGRITDVLSKKFQIVESKDFWQPWQIMTMKRILKILKPLTFLSL